MEKNGGGNGWAVEKASAIYFTTQSLPALMHPLDSWKKDRDTEESLLAACAGGGLSEAQTLVEARGSDLCNTWVFKAVELGAKHGHVEVVRWLCETYPVLRRHDPVSFWNPLTNAISAAASEGQVPVLQWMKSAGVTEMVSARDALNTPMLEACKGHQQAVCQWLLDQHPEQPFSKRFRWFVAGCESGDVKFVEWLWKLVGGLDACVHEATRVRSWGEDAVDMWAPMVAACKSGVLEMAQWVAAVPLPGVDYTRTYEFRKEEPLEHVAKSGSLDFVQWAVETCHMQYSPSVDRQLSHWSFSHCTDEVLLFLVTKVWDMSKWEFQQYFHSLCVKLGTRDRVDLLARMYALHPTRFSEPYPVPPKPIHSDELDSYGYDDYDVYDDHDVEGKLVLGELIAREASNHGGWRTLQWLEDTTRWKVERPSFHCTYLTRHLEFHQWFWNKYGPASDEEIAQAMSWSLLRHDLEDAEWLWHVRPEVGMFEVVTKNMKSYDRYFVCQMPTLEFLRAKCGDEKFAVVFRTLLPSLLNCVCREGDGVGVQHIVRALTGPEGYADEGSDLVQDSTFKQYERHYRSKEVSRMCLEWVTAHSKVKVKHPSPPRRSTAMTARLDATIEEVVEVCEDLTCLFSL
jgi:hypothetical protein